MKAEEDIPRGDQVFDSYGIKDDASFLMNYGFLPPSVKNKALVRAELDPNGVHYTDKVQLLEILKIDVKSYVFMETLENSDVLKTFAWYRFLVFDEKDTEIACDLGAVIQNKIPYVS